LDFYSASSLKQQFAGRHVAPLGHIILIPIQPVFALSPYNAACLAKKQQIPILYSFFTNIRVDSKDTLNEISARDILTFSAK